MSSSATEPQPVIHDFTTSHPSGDAVLITTSDGVVFKVYKSLLTSISSVFGSMLEDCMDDGSPIKVTETSLTWIIILSLVVPDADTRPTLEPYEFEDCRKALEATKKYEMRTARICILDDMLSGDVMDHPGDRGQALCLLQDYESAVAKYMRKLVDWESTLGGSFEESVASSCARHEQDVLEQAQEQRTEKCERVLALAEAYPPPSISHIHKNSLGVLDEPTSQTIWADLSNYYEKQHKQHPDWPYTALLAAMIVNFDLLDALIRELKIGE